MSQQEPRILAFYSQDKSLIQSYREGKDLYSTIATAMYHNNYEDNLEKNGAEAKARRASAKPLVLGISYGMGCKSIAKLIGTTPENAETFLNAFYKDFPQVKVWIEKTNEEARKQGYVEDYWGRKRRLPDMQLPLFEVKSATESKSTFNPLLCCIGQKTVDPKIALYQSQLLKAKNYKERNTLKSKIEAEGYKVYSNSNYIASAERQCVNARIQGSAASMTKIAITKVYKDPELNRMGFKLLISVHDELIGEVDEQYAEEAGERLAYIMRTSVSDVMDMPFKCDATVVKHWYEDELCSNLKKEVNERLSKNLSKEEIYNDLKEEHMELTEDQFRYYMGDLLN